MSSKKRPSGGKRAVEKKRLERDAARRRTAKGGEDPKQAWLEKVEQLGDPPGTAAEAHSWMGRAALLIVQATMRDVGLPPEQMRRDAMRQLEQASKVCDPAKLSEELAELEAALEELRKQHAGHVETGENRPPSPGTAVS